MERFETLKAEILKRAKAASACADEYRRAYSSTSFSELFKVVTDNFWFCNGKGLGFCLHTLL